MTTFCHLCGVILTLNKHGCDINETPVLDLCILTGTHVHA